MEMEEYRRLHENGRKWLCIYLANLAEEENSLTVKNKRQLLRVMSEKFKEFMEKDAGFSEKVIGFVSEKHAKKDKESETFFRAITTYLVIKGKVKEAYAKMYPDEYSLR